MTPHATVPLGDLRKGIEKILNKKDGVDYVQKLLDEAQRQFAGGHPHMTNFFGGYDMITAAGGYQLITIPPQEPSLANLLGGGTVMGDLFANGAKPGTVYLVGWNTFNIPPNAQDIANGEASYAYKALHETFHLACQGGYSDEQMARAACTLANVPPPNFAPNQIAAWSSTFDLHLGAHCPR
jgi:hypothetical protein